MLLELPYEIKLTYIIAIAIMMLFVSFIIIIVFIYNKRQLINKQQSQLKEAEYQNQLLQKELERQKSIEQERERISHDMHDDLGAGISAIKLQAEFIKQRFSNEGLTEDIEDLLKTSEEMNLSMREMMWSLNPKNDTLKNFIDYIIGYTESFLKKSQIAVTVRQLNIQEGHTFTAATRRELFLCIKEAVNNAYKHSSASMLQLVFSQNENVLTIDIIDNGVGFTPKTVHGNGMNNMQLRMQNTCGNLSIIPSATGLHLRFSLPL